MIFRAIFWIAVVSVLMPHEPDLGFGRPHMGEALPSKLSTLIEQTSVQPQSTCQAHSAACTAGLQILDSFQSVAVRSLSEVKADLEQNQHEDFIRRHSI